MAEALPAVLEEEKRIVTVLFADPSGSFGETSDLSPEDQASLVGYLLEMMKDALTRYGGQIERCLGECVLAIFGTAQTHESDPELAIRAAIEIQREARKLGLSLNAGITTGEVYFRRMDSEEPREFTLVGTVVNLAMHLAGKAQAGQILVGESTYDLTRRAFEFVPLSLEIQGRDEPVTAYQVKRLLLHPKKTRGIEGLRAELVGRDGELAKLKAALAKVLAGRGQMVSLIGEAGVGKSRLVAELKAHALHPGDDRPTPLWLEGRCLELGTAASYWPFIDIFREYFGWGARDSDRRRRERIISSLLEMVERGNLSAERFEKMWPLLGLLLSVRLGDEWEERLKSDSPEQIRRRTFLTIHDVFVARAKQHPVVLVFEDLHWADSLSLDLISLLMEGLRLGPLFLLCVYRPEREHKCWHLGTIASQKCRGRYTELRLRELTYQQSQRLVESLLAIENLPVLARDLILDRAQGNPFFIEEVVRSLIDAGLVYRAGDFWHAREELDAIVVPESVQSVILSRVDHLEEDWKHVLQIAAVIGRVFRRRVLEYATQHKAGLARALWKLEDRALIYQERTIPEEEYSFKHVLTQATVYQNILQHRRSAIHQQVAEAIEVLYQDSLDEHYEQLAYHFDQSGHVEKAIAYLLKAGEKAKRSSANEVAIAHLTRGLELLKTLPETFERARRELDLQVALGVPLVLTKGHTAPEVEATYARARELCQPAYADDTPQHFQVLLGLRRFYLHRGELQTALELGEQLLTLAQSAQDSSRLSRAHMMHGETLYRLGEFVRSRAHCEQGLALCDPQQRRFHMFLYGNDTEIGCGIFEAVALWQLGYPDQALKQVREMLALARELSHPFTLVFASYFAAVLHQFRREVAVVQKLVEALLRISTEQGFALYQAWGTVLQGWTLAEQGEIEDGIAQMQQGLTAWRTMGAELLLPNFLSLLAEAYGKVGRVDEGLVLLTEGLGLIDKNGERWWEAELYRLKGELLILAEAKAEDEIEACFLKAIEVARRQEAKLLELRATVGLSRLWHSQGSQGKKEEARQMLAAIYGWFSEGFDTADLKEAKAQLGEFL
jgi:class 3 adenylate cyclase/predicted ATPase